MNEPKLRFPGYTGPLKRISCGELFRERKEKGQDHLPILTLSIHTGISDHELDDAESIKKVKRSEDKSLYKRVYPNDLAFNMMRAWQGAFGVSKVDGMISPAYIVAEPIKKINADYLNYYIQTARFIGVANNLSYGVTDFRKRLYWNSFCKIEMHLPSLEEQNKIVALLVSIDNTIDKQNEMISAWEERKKGVMQKLLSQEVRFKADNGSEFPEWEEKRFVNLYCKNVEKNRNLEFDSSETISIASMQFNEKGNGASEDSLSGYKVLRLGDIAFEGHENKKYSHGRFVLNDIGDGIMSPRFSCMRPVCTQVYGFWKYYIHSENVMRDILVRSTKKGTMMHELVISDFLKQSIMVPSIPEQQKIADCFSALDKVIEQQKARLAAWEELKKGLLQQMFV